MSNESENLKFTSKSNYEKQTIQPKTWSDIITQEFWSFTN